MAAPNRPSGSKYNYKSLEFILPLLPIKNRYKRDICKK